MRRQVLFDEGWLFHEGEIPATEGPRKSVLYIQAKTERKRFGPASREHLDSPEYYNETGPVSAEGWERVTLPHDYVISQRPEPQNNETLGFFRYQNAWYRKHFALPELDENARVRLYFEGVAIHCTVYVNGCRMLENNCGYTSFEVDITDVAVFGGENVVAVHIDVSEHEGWWYEGAGIYRDVWLDISESASIDRDGVFVHPERLEGGAWAVPVDAEIRNDGFADEVLTVRHEVLDAAGARVAEMEGEISVAAREHGVLRLSAQVENPALWDVESPNLYTLATTVRRGGEVIDERRVRFGFRTFRFDAQEGFLLNDRELKIKGVCCHQDFGLTGKAVPERMQRYRLELLRQMGANAYRCAHYPHHAATMDALDELGFLVMAETRWFESTPEGMAQLEMLVKRDRNHPGVILWSVGNEEPLHLTDAGRRITRAMIHRVRQLDGTRPVTTAVSNDPIHCKVYDEVDVIGVNYNMAQWDGIHDLYPDKPFVSTECCATGTTRGWYGPDDAARGYVHGYDHDVNNTFKSRERTWKALCERPWAAGGFQWAGIEHRGEAQWPRLCSQSGAIDLYLQKKDAFYQNQSHWLEAPMVHLLPHWNFAGREGEPIEVWAYTNCEKVELYVNGALFGAKDVERYGHAEFTVPYAPGCIEAKGIRGGEAVCADRVETTGAAVKLRLTCNTLGVRADGRDVMLLTCDCVDAQGRHVPDATPMVRFSTNGLGVIAATGSDVCDHEPIGCPDRRMRAGLISVLVRAGEKPGLLRVLAEADGLSPASLEVGLE